MKFKLKLILLFFVSMTFLFGNAIDNLTLFTEEYPPYNYLNKDTNKLEGIYVEVVDYILKDNNSKLSAKDIQLVPWARAYRTTLTDKNTAIFAITYTEERSPLFKWVGPVTDTSQVLIAKKSKKIKINNLEDINKHSVVVVRDDVAEQLLVSSGVDKKKIQEAQFPILCARMLGGDRVDLWAYAEGTARYILKKEYGGFGDYEIVYVLNKGELYIGFNKDTPDEVIEMFQKSLDKLKTVDVDKYNEILNKYI